MCRVCSAGNQIEWKSEICLHQPDIDKPAVFIFPKPSICLQCGFTEFTMSEKELLQVRKAAYQQDEMSAS